MTSMQPEHELDALLTQPSEADIVFAHKLEGDTIVLGAGGKMGPTLVKRLARSLAAAGRTSSVIAVSRFQSSATRQELEGPHIQTISCDLLEREQIDALPEVENVLFMAGRKFGSTADPEVTWAMNTIVPAQVAQRFRHSRIVAFSTGNVYPFVTPEQGGCLESDAPAPLGEYAQSCLGRERIFEYYSKRFNTPCLILRLNYAIDLRYGVLVDIAREVYEGKAVDLSVPAVNVLWQGDANSYAVRSLELCQSPARILNVTGPETVAVQRAAEFFAQRFKKDPLFTGESHGVALLNNAAACHQSLGYPEVPLRELMEAVASWVETGGTSVHNPTKFQVTDGKF